MDFTKIETQEQFDEAIKDRIARAEKSTRETVTKEFNDKISDYEKLKKENSDYAEQVKKFNDEKTTLESTITGNKKTIDELTAQSKVHETNSVKMRIALEKGLPYDLATRLNGATEEEIKQDAESLLKLVNKPTAPNFTNEPTNQSNANDDKEAIRDMVRKLRSNE